MTPKSPFSFPAPARRRARLRRRHSPSPQRCSPPRSKDTASFAIAPPPSSPIIGCRNVGSTLQSSTPPAPARRQARRHGSSPTAYVTRWRHRGPHCQPPISTHDWKKDVWVLCVIGSKIPVKCSQLIKIITSNLLFIKMHIKYRKNSNLTYLQFLHKKCIKPKKNSPTKNFDTIILDYIRRI